MHGESLATTTTVSLIYNAKNKILGKSCTVRHIHRVPILKAFRRPKNLKDNLVRAKLKYFVYLLSSKEPTTAKALGTFLHNAFMKREKAMNHYQC